MDGTRAYAIVSQVLQLWCHYQYARPGQGTCKVLQSWVLDTKMMNARHKHHTAGVFDIVRDIQAILQRTVCR
jgi:hypothetical protein